MKCNKEVTQIFFLRPGCDNVAYEINRVKKFDNVRLGSGEIGQSSLMSCLRFDDS